MVHNGIEYGLMQAYAEGFEIMRQANSDKVHADCRLDLDLHAIAEVWRHGSVVGSWLLDLLEIAFRDDGSLASYTGFVQDSGEGRWTVQTAMDASFNLLIAAYNVPASRRVSPLVRSATSLMIP